MDKEFRLEDPGEGIHEAEIIEVLVGPGDKVKEGDNLFVVETDKAAVEIPSPRDGEIAEIKVSEGDTAEVGDVLVIFAEGDGADEGQDEGKTSDKAAQADDEEEDDRRDRSDDEDAEGGQDEDDDETTDQRGDGEDRRAGSKEDESSKSDERTPDEESDSEGRSKPATDQDRESGPVPATPAVRRLARELNVDLAQISGSGKDGRVLKDDVERAADGSADTDDGTQPDKGEKRDKKEPSGGSNQLPDFSKWGDTARKPVKSVRRAIARRMTAAWREMPHVTHYDRIDVTELERLRRRHTEEIEEQGGKLSLTPFLLKALASALRQFPRFNASFDAEAMEMVLKDYCNIGVALDIERGLMVPVLREVDRKSVAELAIEVAQLAEDLRQDRAEGDVLKGGSFTLTNVGAIGGDSFAPIINHPQVAIFGAGRARLEQVVTGDLDDPEVQIRMMLPVCLGFDHRANDGADAARFMNFVKAILEDQDQLSIRN